MSPTFSIIIPVYNVAPYLRECLDSVLAAARTLERRSKNEELGTVEIICVDDGSTDGSGAILDEYAAKVEKLGGGGQRTLKVLHQPNRGVSAARNAALEVATGEWIWFVDGDDMIHPGAFDWFVRTIAANRDAVSISIPYVASEKCDWSQCAKIGDAERIDGLCPKSLMTFFCGTCGQLIRRTSLKGLRFVPFKRNEDGVFMMELYWRGTIHLIAKTPLYFRSGYLVRPIVLWRPPALLKRFMGKK